MLSQIEEHAAFGGVVPEIAARAHVEALDGIVEAALARCGRDAGRHRRRRGHRRSRPDRRPDRRADDRQGDRRAPPASRCIAINHLEGHALTARLTDGLDFPYLLLLVSGGHTQIVLVRGVGDYQRWATTIDDALGEAFDKTAKLLGLPYPGGPEVEKAAATGDRRPLRLPAPAEGRGTAAISPSPA